MENLFKILFLVSKSEKRLMKDSKSRIYARITIDGKRFEFSTGEFIMPSEWNHKKGKVKGTNPVVHEINDNLEVFKLKINDACKRLLKEYPKDTITAKKIKQMMDGELDATEPIVKEHGLLEIFQAYVEEMKTRVGDLYAEGTYKKYIITSNKLKCYISEVLKKEDVPLSELTAVFAYDFNMYLTSKKRIMKERAETKKKCKDGSIKNCTNNGSVKYIVNIHPLMTVNYCLFISNCSSIKIYELHNVSLQ